MISVVSEHIRIDEQSLVKLSFELSKDTQFETLSILMDEHVEKVVATTCGLIKDNEITVNKFTKNIECFIRNKTEDISVAFNFFKNNHIINSETINIKIKKVNDSHSSPYSPVIFTGNKGMESFIKRIENKILSDWNVELILKNDLEIHVGGKKRNILTCLGTSGKDVKSKDLVFTIYSEDEKLMVPRELLEERFENQTIALYLLVKPDFQKKIKNIYYKSQISNDIKIDVKEKKTRSITDYSNPVGSCLDPLLWVINYDSQLPLVIN